MERYLNIFCSFPHKCSCVLVVTSRSIHLTSLSKSSFCALVARGGRTARPCRLASWPWHSRVLTSLGGQPALLACRSPRARSGWFKGPCWVEGRKASSSRISSPSSGVTCCCGPGRFSGLPRAGQPEGVTGAAMLTVRGKDLGLRLALLSPVQY